MRDLIYIIRLIIKDERRALLRGFALSVVVLAMGAGLLGLSGWFITASAAAGIAGLGILFNVFGPSAMVRFLALGRTIARYGERVLTHDATLRAVSHLRVRLLEGMIARPHRALERLRANTELNRITADTDALDGALLRLVLPAFAGVVTISGTAVVLWIMVDPGIAVVIGGGYLLVPTAIFFTGQRVARNPARQAEAALQAGRSRLVDLISGRDDLAVYGQLEAAADHTRAAFGRHATARIKLDQIERLTGAALEFVGAIITAGALALGVRLVQAGEISPATAAIGVFVALALGEAVAPVRRALSEIGRMTQAARRVAPSLGDPSEEAPSAVSFCGTTLRLDAVSYAPNPGANSLFAPITFTVSRGETVVLVGPSGSGKSTVLLMAMGALAPSQGEILYGGLNPSKVPVSRLTEKAVLVPQRHALIVGTVAENLQLAAPGASDEALWRALEAVRLSSVIEARGGLKMWLGPRGRGLSGGEARRLVLARAILRGPEILLLDEPTEGLDGATARAVMAGLRQALPDTAFLIAAHRAAERDSADRIVPIIPS